MNTADKYTPRASKAVLLLLAGSLWFCVGIMLLYMAASWLLAAQDVNRVVFAAAGIALAMAVHRFGFLKIVDKNLARILPVDEKRCLFSFMPWKSYILIMIMMTLGALLRHSTIPRHYLAILYTGIGLALVLSSGRYGKFFLKEISGADKPRCDS
jgi:hypothetical protein